MAYIAGVSGGIEFQEEKSADITPSANWSGAYTNYSEINPDTGYDAMEKVKVRTPMLRDYTLMNVSQVDTPGTVYNGNTAQSNSAKMLRVAPTKDGMSYTNSYLEVPASSVMGNATAADVASGKTFSSGNGIALTGTGQMGEDLKNQSLFFGTGMHSGAYSVYDPDVGDYIDINENILQLVSRQDGMVHRTGGGTIWMRKNQYLGDAAASDVLSGKKFSSANGIQIQGSITTRSASSETISAAKTYQAGYYPNGWTVTPQGQTTPIYLVYYDSSSTDPWANDLERFYLTGDGKLGVCELCAIGNGGHYTAKDCVTTYIPLPENITSLSQIKEITLSVFALNNYTTNSGTNRQFFYNSKISSTNYWYAISSTDEGSKGTIINGIATSSNRIGIKLNLAADPNKISTRKALAVSWYESASSVTNRGVFFHGMCRC